MRILLVGLIILLSGCASPEWRTFVEAEFGYNVIEAPNEHMQSCKYPARFTALREKGPLSFGVSHRSNYDCGWPVNNKSEYWQETIFVRKRFEIRK